MNPRILAAALAAFALLAAAVWFFLPRSTAPDLDPALGNDPAHEAVAVPAIPTGPQPDAGRAAAAAAVPDPDGVPVVVLAGQPGEIGDALGNRPINEVGLDAAVTEMAVDLEECHAALAGATPDLPATLELRYEFNVEAPPPAYGTTDGEVAMLKSVRVAGAADTLVPAGPAREAFEACVLRSLDDILYVPSPAGPRVRALHEVTFGAE